MRGALSEGGGGSTTLGAQSRVQPEGGVGGAGVGPQLAQQAARGGVGSVGAGRNDREMMMPQQSTSGGVGTVGAGRDGQNVVNAQQAAPTLLGGGVQGGVSGVSNGNAQIGVNGGQYVAVAQHLGGVQGGQNSAQHLGGVQGGQNSSHLGFGQGVQHGVSSQQAAPTLLGGALGGAGPGGVGSGGLVGQGGAGLVGQQNVALGGQRQLLWSGENPSETLRTFDLPKLEEDATALKFGDWMSLVDAQMADLSYTSCVWWSMVKDAVESCYRQWLVAGPFDRLKLKPQLDPAADRWPRTEKRALAMLLSAIPEGIRCQLVASRQMTSASVLFRLYTQCQPGGAAERTKLLHLLVDSKMGNSAQDSLEWLRMWRRNLGRASELGVQLPDPLVLLGTLAKVADNLSKSSAQVAFRLNSVRQQLNLDGNPLMENLVVFAEHLHAEAEEMVLSSTSSRSTTTSTVKAAAMNVSGDGGYKKPYEKGSSSVRPCRYWKTDGGCLKADQCTWAHTKLEPHEGRCFRCSAPGHSKGDCPAKWEGTPGNDAPKHGGGGAHGNDQKNYSKKTAKVGKTSKPNSQEKKGGEKDDVVGTKNATPSTTSTSSTTSSPLTSSTVETKPGVQAGGSQESSALAGTLTTLLKSINVNENVTDVKKELPPRKLKMITVKKAVIGDVATGLLDGGATNPLRRGTKAEIAAAVEVTVELAHGCLQLHQDRESGTILTENDVEPIVPLRGLIELGYAIKWSATGCEVRHPSRGRIRCWLRGGCPVVEESHALALIGEIEQMEREKKKTALRDEETFEEVVNWWSTRFPEVPSRVWKFMAGQEVEPDPHRLPWNRHQRKRHKRAKALIIHLYAGKGAKEWRQGWPDGIEVVTVDLLDGQNIQDPHVWSYLWQLASSGRVCTVLAGPPCRTVSRLLYKRPGPPPLRARTGPERFGLERLTSGQQQKTDGDTALFLKALGLYMRAEDCKVVDMGSVGFCLESPQDPSTYDRSLEASQMASFWAWQETKDFLEKYEDAGMILVTMDQGALGHQQRKPTGCMTNLPEMEELNGLRCQGAKGQPLEEDLQQRLAQTAEWSSWAPGFKAAIRAAMGIQLKDMVKCPQVAKVLDIQGWKDHILQGHRPYRRDCRTCALEMAADAPHRRREHAGRSSWCMSLDLVAMPYAKDLSTGRYARYVVVATALVPVFEKEEEKPPPDPDGPVEVVDADWGEGCDDAEDDQHLIPDVEVLGSSKSEEVLEKEIEKDSKPWKVRHM